MLATISSPQCPCMGVLQGPAHTIEGFYSTLGLALLGTVVDGDCGIDVACQMEGLPQTAEQRTLLREEPLGHFRCWKSLQRAVVSLNMQSIDLCTHN